MLLEANVEMHLAPVVIEDSNTPSRLNLWNRHQCAATSHVPFILNVGDVTPIYSVFTR